MLFQNELLLILSLIICFGSVILLLRLFGRTGVLAWTVLETIAANIEVLILIRAFGMEMTLGNTLFASSFLATDILSEIYGKKSANKAVFLGICTMLIFLLISITWQFYLPSENDFVSQNIRAVFLITPRIMLASLTGYIVSEFFDVWLYHTIWNATAKKSGQKKFLWLRNNGATLCAQFVNTIVFNVLAFWGIYETRTLLSIVASTYIIYIFTSLLDTPFVYLARHIAQKHSIEKNEAVSKISIKK